jgi:hypothetical protein
MRSHPCRRIVETEPMVAHAVEDGDRAMTQGEPVSKRWVLALTSLASFMIALDAPVVATALSTIRRDLGASSEALQWTMNAYNLSFAVLLRTGAALGTASAAGACSCPAWACSSRPRRRARWRAVRGG